MKKIISVIFFVTILTSVFSQNDIEVTVNNSTNPEDCDGSIHLFITNGNDPSLYTFVWRRILGTNINSQINNQNLTGLCEGIYCVEVTDPDCCVAEDCFEVCSEFNIIGVVTQGNCANAISGGKIKLIPTPGKYTSYVWDDGSNESSREDLEPGEYCVTATRVCVLNETITSEECFTIEENSCSGFDFEVFQLPCEGQSNGKLQVANLFCGFPPSSFPLHVSYTEVNPFKPVLKSGREQITYSNRTFTLHDIPSGLYSFIVDDCPSSQNAPATFYLNSLEVPEIDDFSIIDEKCEGDKSGEISITMTQAASPHRFEWFKGNGIITGETTSTISNLSAGIYSVKIWGNNPCDPIKKVLVVKANPDIEIDTEVTPTCLGLDEGEINLTVSGGTPPFSFLWSNGEEVEDLTGLSPGSYMVIVSDKDDLCQKALEIEVPSLGGFHPDDIKATIISATIIEPARTSGDGSISLEINGEFPPFDVLWDNGSTSVNRTNLTHGFYDVTISDANGCHIVETYEVLKCNNNGSINLRIPIGYVTTCSEGNGSIEVLVSGSTGASLTYNWTGPPNSGSLSNTSLISGLTKPGEYCLEVTDDCGRTGSICQTLLCECPNDIEFDFRLIDKCLDKYRISFDGDAGIEFTGVSDWGSVPPGPLKIDWTTSGHVTNIAWGSNGDPINTSGPMRVNVDDHPNDPMTFDVLITDAFGCTYNRSFAFGNETSCGLVYNSISELIDDTFVTGTGTSGEPLLVGASSSQSCPKGIDSKQLHYSPNDSRNPCGGGGRVTVSLDVDDCDIDIDITPSSDATTIIDYSSERNRGNGTCEYDVLCVFSSELSSESTSIGVQTTITMPCGDPPPFNNCLFTVYKEFTSSPEEGCSVQKWCIDEEGEELLVEVLHGGIEYCKEEIDDRDDDQDDDQDDDRDDDRDDDDDDDLCNIKRFCDFGESVPLRTPAFVLPDLEIDCDEQYEFLGQIVEPCDNFLLRASTGSQTVEDNNKFLINSAPLKKPVPIFYPNPFNEQLEFSIDVEEKEQLNISIYSLLGKKILDRKFSVTEGHNIIQIDTKDFSKGNYIAKVYNKSGMQSTFKLVKM